MNSPEQIERHGALVIGARTRRQGTGPFIAAGLAAAGLPITGILGTSTASVNQAREQLSRNWQLAPATYTRLDAALAELQPLAVAVCSPWSVHESQLQAVATAGCHCLVEKPLAWPASASRAEGLLKLFTERGLLVQVVNQWPTTLAAFSQLHGGLPASIDSFRMRLSPISIGSDMVTDSAPHFLGMLDALCGPGQCEAVRLQHGTAEAGEHSLELRCRYKHGSGQCDATLLLQTQQQRPRPAWYEINQLRVDRAVEMPAYQQSLVSPTERVPLEDPMHLVTREFVEALQQCRATDSPRLLAMHNNLLTLAAAWE